MSYLKEAPEFEKIKNQFLVSEEEFERLKIRKILDKIYEDKTILLPKERYHQLSKFVIAVDLTHYCLARCPFCQCHQPVTANACENWVRIYCSECQEELLFLWRDGVI